jgi:phenylacetate-coenzyme A ligase PaaK-like adenylate-forming protein
MIRLPNLINRFAQMYPLNMNFWEIKSNSDFEICTMQTFHYQHENNSVYRSYCDLINFNSSDLKSIHEIPFLPINFFKTHEVKSFNEKEALTFTSSGTSGSETSKHFVKQVKYYEKSFSTAFNLFYKKPKDYAVLALLPSYLERSGSSLIYMANYLINESNHPKSGFYLNNLEDLKDIMEQLEKEKQPTILLGVSFALLDLIERFKFNLNHVTVMETGGMKGRRKELIREDLHEQLCSGFGVSEIHSEYGMTELLSQAYSRGNGLFSCPPWMRIFTRDTSDPFTTLDYGMMGNLNIIDLANRDSCAFIATQDLGRIHSANSFEVLGRVDNSDIRGCNLLVY